MWPDRVEILRISILIILKKHFVTEISSWYMKKPDILFDLHTSKKSASDSLTYYETKCSYPPVTLHRVSTYLY